MLIQQEQRRSWLDQPLMVISSLSVEKLIIAVILILAVVSRFYDVGLRVMSHDEVNHVVPAYELYQGNGYRHDPVTHGPLQFHLIAASYFMLGDSDFSARVPAALFSTAAVAVVLFGFRRYLGRTGSLVAGFLYLISPYLLFYGRYTRNEAIIELLAVVLLYGMLRYLDRGDHYSLLLITIATVLNFTAKETAFIYTAQALLFVAILFLIGISKARWANPGSRDQFILLVGGAFLMLGLALGLAVLNASMQPKVGDGAVEVPAPTGMEGPILAGEVFFVLAAIVLAILAIILVVKNVGWKRVRSIRSFDILILLGTLVLPLLSPFPTKLVGWNPLDYTTTGMLRTGIFLVLLTGIAVAVGLWWKPRVWLLHAAIFYVVFIVLYTTFFTNGNGFFTGLVGGLGYWLSQQSETRGDQPWYYYAFIQLPIYEYLSLLGAAVAVYFGVRFRRFSQLAGFAPVEEEPQVDEQPVERTGPMTLDETPLEAVELEAEEELPARPARIPVLSLLVYWTITSLIAYSLAGEKMPWLTVHIALPLALTAAWGFGSLIDTTPWHKISNRNGWLGLALLPVLLTSLASFLGVLLGATPPFSGNTIEQLEATSRFIVSGVMAVASAIGIVYLFKDWLAAHVLRLGLVVFFAFMALLTIRTAYMATFVNYDTALEYLVYAHAARGPKDVLEQVEEISMRMTGGKDILVAYDADALYPYWWYLRDYPNYRWYNDQPTRDLNDYPLIIAGDTTSSKMGPIVQDNYIDFEYMRLWWPEQSYFNLTFDRVWGAISDPQMRTAVFNIWFDRDYSLYAELTKNESLTLENWQPSSRMHFYVRKDVVAQIWNYGVAPASELAVETDPYEESIQPLPADVVVGDLGSPVQFLAPAGVAVAPDNSVYVADSRNHRIVHLDENGQQLGAWGSFADASTGDAPGGTFNEPWGVAVSPDGTVFVADTWNHRIQKFTADGEFLQQWGYFGRGEAPDAFYGPRDIAVDAEGRVYLTDTGNKRIVVFDANGEYVSQFGTTGFDIGQFDEPVGVDVGIDGSVYVADTWNRRVQVFEMLPDGPNYFPLMSWDVRAWMDQSVENKPYIAANDSGVVYITDPKGYRVLAFDSEGNFLSGWGEYAGAAVTFYTGIAVDQQGNVWVTDASNNRLLRFSPNLP
jgi:uncharacterized protein (TIGR03663 family)